MCANYFDSAELPNDLVLSLFLFAGAEEECPGLISCFDYYSIVPRADFGFGCLVLV